ncbi:MAG: hypothetical protein AUG51_10300 [Acidobacteria bacterium 13_1_20CM_3_53_8]|nr:MAG: hypothetical protein AUG51_10300 [Acidobacteria bacterium 13_1_20CM_3_53_8]
MSGIAGIINLDGKPVDRPLLERMADFMSFRGPDAQSVWSEGNAGFCHAMLRTTDESFNEHQPFSLDGEVWITADARIDGRAELISSLNSKGETVSKDATDVELIARSYRVWGERCVHHLIGDFAFAIWDKQNQHLFCARDHFGIKPFYYAFLHDNIIFSNTLNCLRLHEAVSDDLNDLAVSDFLIFGFNQEFTTTTFADINRLPPAHYLISSPGRLQPPIRYWNLPTGGYIRYRHPDEYVGHFEELLRGAVADRLRTRKVAVSMSGGLDSPSIAAIAKQLSSHNSKPYDLRAFTMVYDRLIPDEERYYSGVTADFLKIPIQYLTLDDYALFERWDQPELYSPEPTDFPLTSFLYDYLKIVSSHSQTVLSGLGGDPALLFSSLYFAETLKSLKFGKVIKCMWRHRRLYGRFPQLGFRTVFKNWLRNGSEKYNSYPCWLDKGLAEKLNIQGRVEQIDKEPERLHPTRPEAYYHLTHPFWPDVFERADPGVIRVPVETRYPFFDVRLLNYLFALPPIPWFVHKDLLRAAIRGRLPEEIRLRPKTPLKGFPERELLRQSDSRWIDYFESSPEMDKYINRNKIPQLSTERDIQQLWLNIRPICLKYWLKYSRPAKNQFNYRRSA